MMTPNGGRMHDGDPALDALLAEWATRHAPSSEHLEAVRRAVLKEGEGTTDAAMDEAVLPLEWWERFFADLQASMRRAASLDVVLTSVTASAV